MELDSCTNTYTHAQFHIYGNTRVYMLTDSYSLKPVVFILIFFCVWCGVAAEDNVKWASALVSTRSWKTPLGLLCMFPFADFLNHQPDGTFLS